MTEPTSQPPVGALGLPVEAPDPDADVMELTGTLLHCGIPLAVENTGTKWSGILELRTTRLHCNACEAGVTVSERVPVGPPQRVEEFRARAARAAARLRGRPGG